MPDSPSHFAKKNIGKRCHANRKTSREVCAGSRPLAPCIAAFLAHLYLIGTGVGLLVKRRSRFIGVSEKRSTCANISHSYHSCDSYDNCSLPLDQHLRPPAPP